MISALVTSLSEVLSVSHLMYMGLGVSIGLLVGIIPGLGGIAGMALLLPFLYGMEPGLALGMLMGMVAVIPTGDTFTSVLMGIPGSSASQATVMDGFPLAKKGEAARALSSAFLSSLCGGVIGAIVLTGFILIARPLVLTFSSAELFVLTLLGLAMVAVLSSDNLYKGLAACGLGLLVGAIGTAPATGEFRLNLGVEYLFDGVPLIVVGLAIFALPEVVDLLIRRGSIAQETTSLGHGWRQGLRDVRDNRGLVAKCACIGSIIGTIPGLAGSVVDWITYAIAAKTAKGEKNFGKGDIRGVIAPESANNACACGAMVPTLLFGVPGSGTAAIFLGGLLLLGLEPGVTMVTTNLDLTYTIIWSLALANILGAGLCLMLARPVAQVTRVPFVFLAPIITTLILFAAFQATRSLGDWYTLIAIGAIGLLFKQAGWSRPAFLIGFVLAPGAETYFYQSVQFHGMSAFMRPGVIVILSLIVLAFAIPLIKRVYQKKHKTSPAALDAESSAALDAESAPLNDAEPTFGRIDLTLIVGLLALAAGAWYDVSGMSTIGGIFPMLAIGIMAIGALLAGVQALRGNVRWEHQPIGQSMAWLAGLLAFVALASLFGFVACACLMALLFIRIVARANWGTSLLVALGIGTFLLTMQSLLNLEYPSGWIDSLMY
ncbi:tripartite tricarboxylate transporter permease [Larsenimonas rhizosphaerae]|uniref:Tripartite tricarboxylate transporter permease n=1 Tax=Larsenimonas rhizosphaerae TaxID=2944682 RepID=A0AA41ZJF7_9GAMM|nr:tripartite tricarboxylate transporter permease [Larsenimonas rhizosphaerae]MCM2131267.1 tripartite tricarboxylate transporter permease [Larsenimonas rhizosphaerae]MCX2525374.1 tripartite tricarboxylate transporter permease [Larsenimonas rhizosphaerae]